MKKKLFLAGSLLALLLSACGGSTASGQNEAAPAQADSQNEAVPAQADSQNEAEPAQADSQNEAAPAQADSSETDISYVSIATIESEISTCPNYEDGKEPNFIYIPDDISPKIEKLGIRITSEDGSILDEFEIQNPEDHYCISPVIKDGLSAYDVEFTVNDNYCWTRSFSVCETPELKCNIISCGEENGQPEYGSTLAG